jgi:DNA-binding response OmpR family regulator
MSKRILIVDDEHHIRRMIRLALETAGYEIGEAEDGNTALQLLVADSIWDLVLLDQKMPGIDGLQVLREITNRGLEIPIIMITAFASIELAVEAMKLGASDFVRKPMTPEILRDAVSAALKKQRTPAPKPIDTAATTSAETAHALIHTITMNGFEILRPPDIGESVSVEPGERVFRVKNPRGWEREVIVEIPDEVVGYAERMTRRHLPRENSFWTHRAERVLATYLWNEGRFPDQRLTLSDLSPEELDVATRWERDES